MKMDKKELPKDLVFVIKLASGITSVVSITYLILSIFGLIYYFNCDAGIPELNSGHFWSTVYKAYLQNPECNNQTLILPEITKSYTVFVLISITLSFSIVSLLTSAALFFLIDDPNQLHNYKIYIYVYICSWVGTLVVDLTLASHFGIDVANLAKLMDVSLNYDFALETLRIGAFFLMTIALKGYVIHLVSLVVIMLMIIFLYQYQEEMNKEMHSIHSQIALDAFESYGNSILDYDSPPRPHPDNDRRPEHFYRKTWNEQPAAQPQQHQMNSPVSMIQGNSSERPFSYLEDRPVHIKPTVPRSIYRKPGLYEHNMHVPAPDYSPHSQRRLKSVLKTTY